VEINRFADAVNDFTSVPACGSGPRSLACSAVMAPCLPRVSRLLAVPRPPTPGRYSRM
jgi:hypothetical protein